LLFLCLVSCNKEDQLRLEQLQNELSDLEQTPAASVPGSVDPQTEEPVPFCISFDKEKYGVDAGGSVTVEYTLPSAGTVTASAAEGWTVTVDSQEASGVITVTAPDPASPVDIVLTANDADGNTFATVLPLMVRDPYTDATRTYVNAMGYYGFKPHVATLENFQKLADAGLKMITVETDAGDYLQQMDLANQVGMKCIPVVWGYAERYARYLDSYTGLDDIINELKDHPATYAYHIYDEPSTSMIPSLKLQKDKIESLDPKHPVYINLCPDGSSGSLGVDYYWDYIETYIRDCGLKFVSYDLYPCRPDGATDYPDGVVQYFYMCLEAVSSLTRQYGIPFWAFAASCWIDRELNLYAKPSVENLRFQVYTDLAYGAQVIEYFTIMQYGGTDFAPMMIDGTWSEAYDILKAFNLEMQNRGFVFDGCKVDKVRHTNLLPSWGKALSSADLPLAIESIVTSQDATVSFFSNRGNEYVSVGNKSMKEKMNMTAVFNEMVYTIDHNGVFAEHQPGEASFTLDEGDMLVIKVK